jgi:2-oxoglutarate ferredoxin oxidoreductase subunit delta
LGGQGNLFTQPLEMDSMNSHELSHQRKNDFIRLDTRLCEACWKCIEVCPKKVLGKIDMIWHRHAVIRNGAACNGCKKCVWACESGALEYIYVPNSEVARSLIEKPASGNGLSAYNMSK